MIMVFLDVRQTQYRGSPSINIQIPGGQSLDSPNGPNVRSVDFPSISKNVQRSYTLRSMSRPPVTKLPNEYNLQILRRLHNLIGVGDAQYKTPPYFCFFFLHGFIVRVVGEPMKDEGKLCGINAVTQLIGRKKRADVF